MSGKPDRPSSWRGNEYRFRVGSNRHEQPHTVGFCCLPVAMIKRGEREPESSRQIEIQSIVALEMVSQGEFHDSARGEQLEVHADVEAVKVLESFPQLGAFQNFAPVLAEQHVSHLDAPLNGNVQDRAFGRSRVDRVRIGGAFGSFLEEPGERDAGVQHQLSRHQRARRSPRASASACPAVRAPRILCRRRIFAAIRLPAARRFAATTLRETIKGSETFMAAPILLPRPIASNNRYGRSRCIPIRTRQSLRTISIGHDYSVFTQSPSSETTSFPTSPAAYR